MTKWVLPVVLAVALVFTGIWGYNQYRLNQQYSIHMDNIYQKSFYELVGNVGNVETRLAKLMVSGDRGQHMMLLSEVSRQADAAQADLGQLPVSHIALDKTSKYLNQLSDYCYYLSKKVSGGKTLSTDEMNNLRKLHSSAVRLNEDLNKMQQDILQNRSGWGELASSNKTDFYEASDDIYTRQFVNIQKTGIDYPTLIYDGPFSEALDQKGGSPLKGASVTQEQALNIAEKFIGNDRVARVEKAANSTNGILDTWGVNVWMKEDPDNPFYLSISKKGGKVVNMIGQHTAGNAKLSIDEAMERAREFLKQNGYPDMVPTYQQQFDGLSTINFAYAQGNVIVYPDLIKVKIGLDNGKIYGFEARNYLLAHKERNLGEPKLSMEEAKQLVSPNLKITSSRMAVIPTESKQERLCYEFKGDYGGSRFIVYIDANTGEEADILQVIDTKNGSLTM
jgi:spore germination protein